VINPGEMGRRSKIVMNKLMEPGSFNHNDLGFYFLSSNANRNHLKTLLRRQDAKDCLDRVGVMYPLVPASEIPDKDIASLPEELKEMLHGLYKIEWHYECQHHVMMSDQYKRRYKFVLAKGVYTKCRDTIGLDPFTMAMKMWLETLHRPGKMVTYQGTAYHTDTCLVTTQTVKMMSVVYDYDHFITVTQVI